MGDLKGWKVGEMEENYKTMPNILQQKKARLRGGSPEERVGSWKCKVWEAGGMDNRSKRIVLAAW